MTPKQVDISKRLRQFYQHPVAQVSLEVVFSIMAVIFFALFAIKPTLVTMSNLVKELNDKKVLNEQLKQKIAALSSVQTEYSIVQPRLNLLDEAIPSEPDFEQAMLQIEKLASDRGVVITNVQIKDIPKKSVATDAADLTRLSRPLAIDIQGDFTSIRSLVEDIGNIRRQITVESVQFNLTDVLGKKKLRATLTMSVHYFGAEKKIGVAETAPAGGEDAALTR